MNRKYQQEQNMDYAFEEHFVNTFINKSRRERLLHELTKPDKRYEGISRFCHQAKQLLDPSKIIMEGNDIDRCPKFTDFVRQHNETCLMLSPDYAMDGQLLPLPEALNNASICPDAVIIAGSSFAIVFTEPVKGGRDKYLLSGN